ncbi:DUF6039 family protein [Streptomyces sp. NPDC057582]|uniref:DUF6039 family protein n=1 Tax=Streptomyces sp. NPDC057582 TaxID=3346174 RepID=UPI0036D0EDA2
MSIAPNTQDSADRTALHQAAAAGDDVLQSANAGVVVERTAVIAAGLATEAHLFARQLTEAINKGNPGTATAFVYDETFGVQGRLHWMVHLRSMGDYERIMRTAATGPEPWSRLFVPGSVKDRVMLPQFWGMYNTSAEGDLAKQTAVFQGTERITGLPPAYQQTTIPLDRLLNSANCGVLIHRTGVLDYDLRSEGRQFAREVAESINSHVGDDVSVFVYEGAFGPADHLHWLIHMRSMDSYFRLLEMHVRNEDVRDLYFRELISVEKGGGTWARMFLPGTLVDTAMTPQQWHPDF